MRLPRRVSAICPDYGIGTAATTLVGDRAWGAGKKKLAKNFADLSVLLGCLVMTACGIVMYFLCPAVFAMLTPDLQVRELGVRVLRIELFAEPFYAASIVSSGALRGAGDSLIPSILNLISMWGRQADDIRGTGGQDRSSGSMDRHGGRTVCAGDPSVCASSERKMVRRKIEWSTENCQRAENRSVYWGLETVSMGASGEKEVEAAAALAVENGINYFDMAAADFRAFRTLWKSRGRLQG